MEQSISQISLSSRIGSALALRSKHQPSTKHDSHLLEIDSSCSSPVPTAHPPQPSRLLHLQSRIREIERSRAELQTKFAKTIQNLQQEINRKEEVNARLEGQIKELSLELTESKTDLGIITQVIRRQEQKTAENASRAHLINTVKITPKLEKSVSGSKQTVDLGSAGLKVDRKNRSPRLLQQKSFKE